MRRDINKIIIVIISVVIFVGLVGGGWWYLQSRKTDSISENQERVQKSQTTKFSKNVFFIHHSTGEIYWNGGMEKSLKDAGYETAAPWWDGNTDPGDFYAEFSDSTKWQILEPYSIIIFKSCFPASNITTDQMLADYKTNYLKLYEIYQAHPDKLFVPLSTPPLLQAHTDAAAAKRSLDFEAWLIEEYKDGYDGNNLAPFALHSLLSDNQGYLKAEFISSAEDDHPNPHAGEVVGPAIVKHLSNWVQ